MCTYLLITPRSQLLVFDSDHSELMLDGGEIVVALGAAKRRAKTDNRRTLLLPTGLY